MKIRHALGIDIGGSGIKGAVVDLKKGEFTTDRLRIVTPQPATPEAVAEEVRQKAPPITTDLGARPEGKTLPANVP
ncbi:MAG: ROK family protein, partial [Propionibacteriaceae bacterium]|nr:ROK family protein [Propionibacteriaceae bacterium]